MAKSPRSPEPQTVELMYGPGTLTPIPDPVKVVVGDTLSFKMIQGPPNGKLTITIEDSRFFSAGAFKDGDSAVRVNTALPIATRVTYDCEVRDRNSGALLASQKAGGSIEPDPGH